MVARAARITVGDSEHEEVWSRSNRRRAYDMAASVARGASPVCEVTLADQPWAEIFDFAKAQGRQFGAQRFRFKFAPEGLFQECDARGKRLSGLVVFILVRARGWGISVVEHDVRSTRQAGDESECRKDGLFCQIGHNAQPGEKGLLLSVEAGRSQAVRQNFPLQIDRSEGE